MYKLLTITFVLNIKKMPSGKLHTLRIIIIYLLTIIYAATTTTTTTTVETH